jgi:glycosyltransferase involved in cell wall biosynthesis
MSSRRVKVFPWPNYRTNPYLPRLMAELGRRGFEDVESEKWSPGVAPLEAGDWVHLHWPGAKLQAPFRPWYRLQVGILERRLAALHRRGVRLAWTAHNLFPHDDPAPDLARRARLAVVNAVEHVFVHFPGAEEPIREQLGYRGPITVIPHGHYADSYPALPARGEARARLGVPERAWVVLLFGALRPYKGLGEAIAGFLAMAGPHDRLIVAGKPDGAAESELAAGRADPRVIFDERLIPDAEVPGLFAAADVFLVAHKQFFTSGSAVLALTFGLPVVGPPIHHLAALGPAPRVFPAESSTAGIADGLRRARAHGPVDRQAIQDWAQRELSWATAGERVAAVLGKPR